MSAESEADLHKSVYLARKVVHIRGNAIDWRAFAFQIAIQAIREVISRMYVRPVCAKAPRYRATRTRLRFRTRIDGISSIRTLIGLTAVVVGNFTRRACSKIDKQLCKAAPD